MAIMAYSKEFLLTITFKRTSSTIRDGFYEAVCMSVYKIKAEGKDQTQYNPITAYSYGFIIDCGPRLNDDTNRNKLNGESVPDVCLRLGPPLLNCFFISSDSLCIESPFPSLFHFSFIN